MDANDLAGALDRLDRYLRDQGAPVRDDLRPGLTPDRIVASVAADGLELPATAVTWFAWHDGAGQHTWAPSPLGTWTLHSLDAALEHRRKWLQLTGWEPDSKLGPDRFQPRVEFWEPRWLPLAQDHSGRPLMVVCGGDRNGAVDLIHYEDSGVNSYPSLLWVVEYWIELFDQGLWWIDPDTGRWRRDSNRMSAEQRRGPY